MKKYFILFLISFTCNLFSQNIFTHIPEKIDPSKKYIFYLHGKIIEDQGTRPKSEKYGIYEYEKILQVLSEPDYIVISEARSKNTVPKEYAPKIAKQIDTLLKAGVPEDNITVIGASKGAGIAFQVSNLLKNENIKFVLMAICNTETSKFWKDEGIKLWGRVLYIYDTKDEIAGSCKEYLDDLKSNGLKEYKEIEVKLGLGHGLLYTPLDEWVIPAKEWARKTKDQTQNIDRNLFQKAKDIADKILIIDCHNHDLFMSLTSGKNIQPQVTFPNMKTGGVKGIIQNFPVGLDTTATLSQNIISDIKIIQSIIMDKDIPSNFVYSSKDILSSFRNNRTGIFIGIESFKGLAEGKTETLQKYYDAGVRIIGIHNNKIDTFFEKNELTRFGKDFIRAMNQLGIIGDLTHMRGIYQRKIIETSKAPCFISHSAVYTLINSNFNVKDSTLEILKAKGGIIGLTFYSGQLSNESLAQLNKGIDWLKITPARIEELIDQIDYLKINYGIDYIAIGTDYGGSGKIAPSGLENCSGIPLIIYHLLKRGYTETEIEKVMGLNFIKFFEKVEKIAQEK